MSAGQQAPQRHTFTLSAADGSVHDYEMTPHPAREGLFLAKRVAGAVAKPLAALLAPLAGIAAHVRASGGTGRGLMQNPELLRAALADVDFSSIGQNVAEAMAGLSDDVIYALLKYVHRDGQSLSTGTAGTLNFDTAFQRNYGELGALVLEVVTYNAFLPVPNTLIAAIKTATTEAVKAAGAALSAEKESSPPASSSGSDRSSETQPRTE